MFWTGFFTNPEDILLDGTIKFIPVEFESENLKKDEIRELRESTREELQRVAPEIFI